MYANRKVIGETLIKVKEFCNNWCDIQPVLGSWEENRGQIKKIGALYGGFYFDSLMLLFLIWPPFRG